VSCAPSPATTSGQTGTSGGCSTACAPISSPSFRPRWPSPATTWQRRPSLGMLQRWPTAEALASAARAEVVAFARANHSRFAERFADRVQTACAQDHFVAPDHPVRAKRDSIRLATAQLLLIGAQRRAWQRRMGELLLGAPRRGKTNKPTELEPGQGSLAAGSTLSFRAWVTVSPPGSPVSSATTSSSSRRRTRCNATRARRP
jgi:hypothetical protein